MPGANESSRCLLQVQPLCLSRDGHVTDVVHVQSAITPTHDGSTSILMIPLQLVDRMSGADARRYNGNLVVKKTISRPSIQSFDQYSVNSPQCRCSNSTDQTYPTHPPHQTTPDAQGATSHHTHNHPPPQNYKSGPHSSPASPSRSSSPDSSPSKA